MTVEQRFWEVHYNSASLLQYCSQIRLDKLQEPARTGIAKGRSEFRDNGMVGLIESEDRSMLEISRDLESCEVHVLGRKSNFTYFGALKLS